jgi:hypothetical protein
MQQFPIHIAMNVWAILTAAVAKFLLGWLWYAPFLFGKAWQRLTGCTPEDMKARLPKAIAGDLLTSVIMAFVLVHAVRYAGATTPAQGSAVGFLNWLGFVFVATFIPVLYEGRPFKLFLINNGFHLLGLMLMGAIIAVWV